MGKDRIEELVTTVSKYLDNYSACVTYDRPFFGLSAALFLFNHLTNEKDSTWSCFDKLLCEFDILSTYIAHRDPLFYQSIQASLDNQRKKLAGLSPTAKIKKPEYLLNLHSLAERVEEKSLSQKMVSIEQEHSIEPFALEGKTLYLCDFEKALIDTVAMSIDEITADIQKFVSESFYDAPEYTCYEAIRYSWKMTEEELKTLDEAETFVSNITLRHLSAFQAYYALKAGDLLGLYTGDVKRVTDIFFLNLFRQESMVFVPAANHLALQIKQDKSLGTLLDDDLNWLNNEFACFAARILQANNSSDREISYSLPTFFDNEVYYAELGNNSLQ